jgi:predicted DNA-binding transcriptional regulator AlpA
VIKPRTQISFLTVAETASMLRKTRKAIYMMIARGQLPGVTRLNRSVLIRADILIDSLEQKCAPSPQEERR